MYEMNWRRALTVVVTTAALSACGQENGPFSPAAEGPATMTPMAAPTVTINGVQLLSAPADGGLALAGRGARCSTSDRRNVNGTGGVLEVCDARLEIPQGAFMATGKLTMRKDTNRDDGLWSYTFGPHGTVFEKSATLTIEVSPEYLMSIGVDPNALGVAYVTSPNHSDWQVQGGVYDWATGTITVEIDHFSRYALCIE